MIMLGYDSTRPQLIPATADAIFPYADGAYAWTKADLDRFPRSRRRFITVTGDVTAAMICDVEHGDVPADLTGPEVLQAKAITARTFITGRAALRRDAVIYCSRDTLTAVQAHCAGLEYRVGLATLDGSKPRCYSGAAQVGVQFLDTGHYDVWELFGDTSWLAR
jgi:hypothetical protein